MADEPTKTTEKPVVKPAPAADVAAKPTTPPSEKKKSSTTKIVLIVVGVLVGLSILGTIATIIVFGVILNKVDDNVDVKNGQVTVKSDDGETKVTAGENATLASGFPTDVPIYEPSTLKASTTSGTTGYGAVAATASSVATVTSYYKTEMAAQGWTTQYESSGEGSSLLTFAKGNRTASVVVSTSDDANSSEKTGFVVSVTTQE